MVYAAQLISVVGSGSLARNITAVVGGSDKTVWFTSIITICTTVLSPPISQAADYWGRKWLLVFLTSMGVVGSIIVSRAQNVGTVLVGFTFSGIAFGAQPLIPTISSEVVPRKLRSYAQAYVNFMGAISAFVALLMGGALTRYDRNANFRVYFYICAGFFAFGAIATAILYNPPPRDLQLNLSFKEKIRQLDWPAYFLLTSGLVLFCIGLSWSQNPYPWSDARVSAPFAVGVVLLICLVLYVYLMKKDGMIHHSLFRHRNFPIALGCLFAEGLSFFSFNNYLPFETSVLFTTDPLFIGLHFGIAFIAGLPISALGGAWSYYTKTLRPPAVFALLLFVAFFATIATVNVNTNPANFWAYPVLAGSGLALCIVCLMTLAQFATPPELISTTTGLVLAVRNLGGTVGLAIYNAVFNHCMSTILVPKIAAATLPLGFPESSLGPFIGAIAADNQTALVHIPHVTEAIIAAGGLAVKETYVICFRYVWVTAGSIAAAALIGKQQAGLSSGFDLLILITASLFIHDPKSEFSPHIDAPVEVETIMTPAAKVVSD